MNVRRAWLACLLAAAATAVGAPTVRGGVEITLGTQSWHQTAPEAKYQEFIEQPQGSFLYSLFLEQSKDRNFLFLYSLNALQENQTAGLLWTNGARFRVDIAYQQLPHNFSQVTRSSYTDAGSGKQLLDDAIQAVNQANPTQYTPIMQTYLAASPDLPLATRSDAFVTAVKARPAPGWTVGAAYEQGKKSGKKAYGGPFGFNHAVEVWEPTEHRVTDGELNASYQKDQFTFRAVAGVSVFQNLVSELVWDNPKRLTDTTASALGGAAYINGDASAAGRLDLYPDNLAWRGELALGWALPRRTMLSGALRVSRHEQDDDWLPYTINSALTQPNDPANALPASSTDAKATALTGDLRVTTRGLGPVGAALRFRFNEYDNKTESYTLPGYVRMDQTWVGGAISSNPYGNQQLKLAGELNYRPISPLLLEAGADWVDRQHTLREIDQDGEVGLFGRACWRVDPNVTLEGAYRYANRVAEDFDIEHYEDASGTLIEQPGLRRFDVASRRAQRADAWLEWTPKAWVQTRLEYRYERDYYPDSELGLQDVIQNLGLLDVMLTPSERVELGGGGGYGQSDADQMSRTSGGTISTNPQDNWSALLTDRNWFAYADFTWWMMPDKLSLDMAYEFSWQRGEYHLSNPTNTAEDLPDTRYLRNLFTATLTYDLWESTKLGARYGYDDYDFVDFANQNVPLLNTTTSPPGSNAIFLADNLLSYTANRYAIYLTQSF